MGVTGAERANETPDRGAWDKDGRRRGREPWAADQREGARQTQRRPPGARDTALGRGRRSGEGVETPVLDAATSEAYGSAHVRMQPPFPTETVRPFIGAQCSHGARMHGRSAVAEANRMGARGNIPEINHLNVLHPSEHAEELLRALNPRTDDREFAEAGEAVERARVLEEIVVEVEHAHVGRHAREVGRQRDEAACRELEVDEVVARLGEEARLEWVACVSKSGRTRCKE